MDTTKELSDKIREYRPLIHSITNYVTVNDCANALLAIGARPVMSHAPEEAAEITSGSDGLELNLGATEYYESMLLSGREADSSGIPIIIDPVGVSGSSYRRNFLKRLIECCHPVAVRGNRSEILAMIRDEKTETGVDSVRFDADYSDVEIISMMQEFCRKRKEEYIASGVSHELILVCSGKTDLIACSDKSVIAEGGSSEMSGVTGTGCMSSVILAAFISGGRMYMREEKNSLKDNDIRCMDFDSAVSAVKYVDAAAERAEANLRYLRKKETLPFGTYGTGSYRVLFIDQLKGNIKA